MKNIFFLLIFISATTFGQTKIDSIAIDTIKPKTSKNFFSDKDLSKIDSLVIESQYRSPLTDNINYVIKGLEAKSKKYEKIPTDLVRLFS